MSRIQRPESEQKHKGLFCELCFVFLFCCLLLLITGKNHTGLWGPRCHFDTYIHRRVACIPVASNMPPWPSRSSGSGPSVDSGFLLSVQSPLSALSLSPSSQPLPAMFLSSTATKSTRAAILGKAYGPVGGKGIQENPTGQVRA